MCDQFYTLGLGVTACLQVTERVGIIVNLIADVLVKVDRFQVEAGLCRPGYAQVIAIALFFRELCAKRGGQRPRTAVVGDFIQAGGAEAGAVGRLEFEFATGQGIR